MKKTALALVLASAVCPVTVSATPIMWINGGSGTWTTTGNWNPAQVPTNSDDVTINNGGTANQVGLPIDTRDLNIGLRTSGGSFLPHGTGTLNLTNGDADVDGNLFVGVTNAGIGSQGSSTGSLTVIGSAGADGDVVADGDVAIGKFIAGPAGTAAGTVEMQGGDLTTGGNVDVGATGGFGSATGQLDILAGSLQGDQSGNLRVGVTSSTGTADGTVEVDTTVSRFQNMQIGLVDSGATGDAFGDLRSRLSIFTIDSLTIGRTNGVGDADGKVASGGLSQVGDLEIGVVGTGASGNATGALEMLFTVSTLNGTGSGDLTVGLTRGSGTADGTLLFPFGGIQDFGNVDVGVVEGVNVSGDATGRVEALDGELRGENTGDLRVGYTNSMGAADGAVEVDTLVSRFQNMQIGLADSGATGDAVGELRSRLSMFAFDTMTVGRTNGVGDADGHVASGGLSQVGDLEIGVVGTRASGNATGALEMLFTVSTLNGTGSGDLTVGLTRGSGTADGTLSFPFGNITGFQRVDIGVVAGGAAGDANGNVDIQGDLTAAASLLPTLTVGTANGGGIADGHLSAGGNVAEFAITRVGQAGGTGDATGSLIIGGMLQSGQLGTEGGFVEIGRYSGAGSANATAEVGGGVTGAGSIFVGRADINAIGNANGELTVLSGGIQAAGLASGESLDLARTQGMGSVVGTATVTGGVSGFETVNVGTVDNGAVGDATGSLILIDGDLVADNLSVAQSMGSGNATGTVDLNDNLATIGDMFALGDGSTIQLDIDGFLRGVDYGAIDADEAILDGSLDVAFSFTPNTGVFDLIVSNALDGIFGDFDAVNIVGLDTDTLVTHGIVIDQVNGMDVEIFRLEVGVGSPVFAAPEPGTLLILVTGLVILGTVRGGRSLSARNE